MKRIFFTALICFSFGLPSFAQSEIDALNLSRNDLTGTARSVSMGGAFGALGGDISGIAINPAGIGVYKTSEIVTTFNFRNNNTKGKLNAGSQDDSKFRFDIDNFGLVGVFPINDDVVPLINFGFSYNKLKTFDRKYKVNGNALGSSLTDFMAERATRSYDVNSDSWGAVDWFGKLGYEGYLIDPLDEGGYESVLNRDEKVNSRLTVREKGSINSFDFNAGTTFADIVSVGLTVAVTDIDYRLSSEYSEDFYQSGVPNEGFDLLNQFKTEGTGYQVKVGAIIKPINELRIGVAYHSPTWYEMTDYHYGDLYSSLNPNNNGLTQTPDEYARTDYDFKTPDKWIFSLAGIIGRTAIISVDYELTNYKSNMRFRDVNSKSYLADQNSYINQDLRNASSIRVGAEIRFTPQLSGRVGYSWIQSPYNDNLKTYETIEPASRVTIPHYIIEGDSHYITYGLGYRFTPNFYADVAFVMKNQKDDLYTFPKYYDNGELLVDNHKAELKNNIFSGLITLGYKF